VDEIEKLAFTTDDVKGPRGDNLANHSIEAGIAAHKETLTPSTNKQKMRPASLPTNHAGQLRLIPPPIFSRIEYPQVYDFKQAGVESLTVEQHLDMEQRGEAMPTQSDVVPRARKQRMFISKFDYKSKDVPTAPPAEALELVKDIPAQVTAYFKRIFDDRPIWTRLAIINSIPTQLRVKIKKLLPTAAYFIPSGAWRECWVRYGYDPRQHPEAAIYQVLDVRNVKTGGEERKFSRGKRNLDSRAAAPLAQGQVDKGAKRKRRKKGEVTDYEIDRYAKSN